MRSGQYVRGPMRTSRSLIYAADRLGRLANEGLQPTVRGASQGSAPRPAAEAQAVRRRRARAPTGNLRGIENRDWLNVLKHSAQICAVAGRTNRRRLATTRKRTSE